MPKILYQDETLLLVEKPVGLLSQESPDGGDSLPRRLKEAGIPVWPIHRLDRETGGVMAYALTADAAARLSALVADHEAFCKTYWAVVSGCPPTESGRLEDWLYHDRRANKTYAVRRQRAGVRKAVLDYRVLETVGRPDGAVSLCEIRLHTGRTHQIRAQFASRGMPLFGDARYGGSRDCPLALWSVSLCFPHPATGVTVAGESRPDTAAYPWNLIGDSVR